MLKKNISSKFGIHINKSSELGTYTKLEDAATSLINQYNMTAIQIFTNGPQSMAYNKYDAETLNALSKDITIYVHSTYITDSFWNTIESNQITKINKITNHIQNQLDAANEINAKGFIIHITRTPINTIIKGLTYLNDNIIPHNITIFLEFKAMRSHESDSYETANKLNNLYAAILDADISIKWKFCLDTSHLWATGIDMADTKLMKHFFKSLKCTKYIGLIHLNAANKSTFNTGRDIHILPLSADDDIWGMLTDADEFANISKAEMSKIKKSTLGILIKWIKKNNIDIIGEFKRGTLNQYKLSIQTIQYLLYK